jgi:hypothetical protein
MCTLKKVANPDKPEFWSTIAGELKWRFSSITVMTQQ